MKITKKQALAAVALASAALGFARTCAESLPETAAPLPPLALPAVPADAGAQ